MTGRAPLVPHATVVVQTCDTCWGWVITGREPQTLAEAGEFGLIAALSAWFPPGPATLVGLQAGTLRRIVIELLRRLQDGRGEDLALLVIVNGPLIVERCLRFFIGEMMGAG